ncbi:hypothetical protein C4D60_Mb06t02280 [Musa balbisiana]|uniref:Uncharacterized protein n=1 Tax=Musa balbisiana TaxID=52838 RepID=A0A4S8IJZ2_MUSBA|nr:hypothetical protein C4D60_Mb06t02280 [Musa balbisiana]
MSTCCSFTEYTILPKYIVIIRAKKAVEIYIVGLIGSQQAEERYEKLPAGGETSLHKGVGDIRNSLKEVCG